MRVYVPRAVKPYSTPGWCLQTETHGIPVSGPDHTPSAFYVCAPGLPGDVISFDVESYFYETHGRKINDCVHSKLKSEGNVMMPNFKVASSPNSIYTARKSGCELLYWDQSPYGIVSTGRTFSRAPNQRVINDGALSMYIAFTINPVYSGTGYTVNLTMGAYMGTIDSKGRSYLKGIERRNQRLEFTWSSEMINPQTRTRECWGKYTGHHDRIAFAGYIVPDSFFLKIGTLIQGMTFALSGSTKYAWPSPKSLCELILEEMEAEIRHWYRHGLDTNFNGWRSSSFGSGTGLLYTPVVPYRELFLLHEDQIIAEGYDPYLTDQHGLPNYWRNVLVQQAYLDALDHVPKLNDNSISNIIEIAGFIKSLVIDKKIELPKSLSDIWLTYRYQYMTTKLDAEEAISFVHRNIDLGTLNRSIECFGESSHHYVGVKYETDIKCRCCLFIQPKDVDNLAKVWRALYTYGLQPNFYVVWDMLPYSFIIDWLIPIGSLAHATDASSMYNGTYYHISDVCFSLSYDIMDEAMNVYHQYSRWGQPGVPQLNGFYFLEEDPVTQKVKGMRILDSLSLFIGKG